MAPSLARMGLLLAVSVVVAAAATRAIPTVSTSAASVAGVTRQTAGAAAQTTVIGLVQTVFNDLKAKHGSGPPPSRCVVSSQPYPQATERVAGGATVITGQWHVNMVYGQQSETIDSNMRCVSAAPGAPYKCTATKAGTWAVMVQWRLQQQLQLHQDQPPNIFCQYVPSAPGCRRGDPLTSAKVSAFVAALPKLPALC